MNESSRQKKVIEAAREARSRSHAPHSGYSVGAAILANGEIYKGSNIEVSGWSTSAHAEMTALFNAVLDGAKSLDLLAISTEDTSGLAPCGLCQHTLADFAEDLTIIADNGRSSAPNEYQLDDLLGPAHRPTTRDSE